jgi:hypothetical protein
MENPWRPDDKQADWAKKLLGLLAQGVAISPTSSVLIGNTVLDPVPVQQGDLTKDTDAVTTFSGALKTLIYKTSASLTYVAEAVPSSATSAAVWRVQKIDTSASPNTILYAGSGLFDQVADDYLTLTYS